ncbi:protein FAR-RED IMPAIRED RESPONSE 1-like [Olea europaea var. sylvestris]|uniref:protein FAR-RED IMPAIRED RESPONSE 1-like n=1 Tax=Olea europaea var. sylvestris TaxID=158386 RepID=UPI000C1D574F|nr:protein FAR-RED IMPAIRED RESPONSE 1-like [Olea europaea var. sylvestris]
MSTMQRSESMNTFFDGYVHSKTSLKQFVEQYKRALRNKVEKEFQADFKEVQQEFMGNVYCDVVSTIEGSSYTTYDVRECITYEGGHRRKTFVVSFQRNKCDSCYHSADLQRCHIHFRRYILQRWRRDVIRAHTRVAVNYAGLVSTPSQLRYEEMSKAFVKVANLAADDETRNVLDPKFAQRKGVPKKIWRKSLLETASNKVKRRSWDVFLHEEKIMFPSLSFYHRILIDFLMS